MTALILYVLLWLWDNRTFDSITKANERKLEAEQAFNDKKYASSAEIYRQITYGSIFSDPAARLNLAHSFYLMGNFNQAKKHYKLLQEIDNKTIASIANSQIALINVTEKDTAGALSTLKTALRLEPGNALARTNYIILKKNFSGTESPSDIKTRKKGATGQSEAKNNAANQPAPVPDTRDVADGVR